MAHGGWHLSLGGGGFVDSDSYDWGDYIPDTESGGSYTGTGYLQPGANEISLPSTKGKWIQLKFYDIDGSSGYADIEIGDISIIYREKTIK